ncbi:MAG: AfsR family transcriptional regulator, partial [Chlorobi bacterium CHB2]|nr:AfsR family transcriptional regulator [Chlorobi bacterium CHB2]
ELLRARVRDAVLAMGKLALRNGLYTPAIEAATVQLSRDPYDEAMHRLLMRLHNDSGNRSAALKQFDKCAKLLKREFDAEPERETMKLRAEIVKG